ncbi:MAG: hypothetical protein SFY56_05555 [Bacteroidota bacterium]|nr:hypothetical protein [Bacteroidota bacterium]
MKANDNLVSFCKCGDGRITYPAQADCPWCGCGWLFTCITCRKAFAFAKCVQLETSHEYLAKEDLRNYFKREPTDAEVNKWVEEIKELLASVEKGEEYVILDGKLINSTETNLHFKGWFASHELNSIPQVDAMDNFELIHHHLTNQGYWEKKKQTVTKRCFYL